MAQRPEGLAGLPWGVIAAVHTDPVVLCPHFQKELGAPFFLRNLSF